MRIHTNHLTFEDMYAATRTRGMELRAVVELRGSKSRKYAYDVFLSGSGRQSKAIALDGDPAATWDEWGLYLEYLFYIDPDMIAGAYRGKNPKYTSKDLFEITTMERFKNLRWNDSHKRHRWALDHDTRIHHCKCGASANFNAARAAAREVIQ